MSNAMDSESFRYVRESFHSTFLNGHVSCGIARFTEDVSQTIYVLHGGGGDDTQPIQVGFPGLLQGKLLERIQARQAQLVFPNIGRSFLRGDFSRYFFDEVIPFAEKDTKTTSETRWIAGYSMGGQAALNAFLRKPEFFAGAGASFPTLIAFDPFDPAQYAAYLERNSVQKPWSELLLADLREFSGGVEFAKHDPIALAGADGMSRNLNGKKIFFDVGTLDEFGLQEGARSFARVLTAQGIAHRFDLVPGGRHDAAFLVSRFPVLLDALIS